MRISFLVFLMICLLTGCETASKEKKPVILKIGAVEEGRQLIRLFKAKYPDIETELVSLENQQLRNKLRGDVLKQKVNELLEQVDVMILPDYLYQEAAREGRLKPLKHLGKRFPTSLIQALEEKGKGLFGLPLKLTGSIFVYNQTIFEEKNLNPPQQWNEFFDVIEQINSELHSGLYTKSMYFLMDTYLRSVGHPILDPRGKINISDDYVKNTWYRLVSMYKNHGISSEHTRVREDDTGEYLSRSGMAIVSVQEYFDLLSSHNLNWDVLVTPIHPQTNLFSKEKHLEKIISISTKSKHEKEAQLFLEFITSTEVDQLKPIVGELPVTKKGIQAFEKKTGKKISRFYDTLFLPDTPQDLYFKHQSRGNFVPYSLEELPYNILKEILQGRFSPSTGLEIFEDKGNVIISALMEQM